MVDVKKTQLAVFIGFLFLILLGIVFYIFRAAVTGNIIARWVLFLIFGTAAVVLASFGIGYVLLLLTKTEKALPMKPSTEISYRQIAPHPQHGTWIDLSQLPSYISNQHQDQKKETKKQPARRSVKRKRQ